jgi:nucleoid-associated protein YgaU
VAQVESYDEETYVCRPSDTFRSISQAYFKTDKYERALLLFNRNHPLATEAVRQNPPALREGQSVYIPPQRILDKYYGSVIGDGSSQAPAAIPTSQSGQQNSPATEKAYRVRANGEMFYDIARRTLGSGERWQEIYRLNPRFDPKDPVPAGSELRVPSDARIDPADAP